jgi:hypothetical protein
MDARVDQRQHVVAQQGAPQGGDLEQVRLVLDKAHSSLQGRAGGENMLSSQCIATTDATHLKVVPSSEIRISLRPIAACRGSSGGGGGGATS